MLRALNGERLRAGQQPVPRLTVTVLKEALQGKLPGNQPSRARSRKREELLADYRWLPDLSGQSLGLSRQPLSQQLQSRQHVELSRQPLQQQQRLQSAGATHREAARSSAGL